MNRAAHRLLPLFAAAALAAAVGPSAALGAQPRRLPERTDGRVAKQPQDKPYRPVQREPGRLVVRCKVPNLIGSGLDAANVVLGQARLDLGQVMRRRDARPPGT